MATAYWTYIDEYGETHDGEYDTSADAAAANESFAEMSDGVPGSEQIELIQFFTADDGERVITQRKFAVVEYEHYQGDYAEHNTHWGI